MTQQEHFNRSVSVLVKAFFEGVLQATNCAACACGNLVAAANGYRIKGHGFYTEAGQEVMTDWTDSTWAIRHGKGFGIADSATSNKQIATTGYTADQFARIEGAFMDVNEETPEAEQFAGLMAVVDVLADIHGIDLAAATAAKALFVRA